jgi:hypothetical protein
MIILLYIGILLVSWLALRHFLSMIIGYNQEGQTKPGQRLCHFVSFMILCGGCVYSFYTKSVIPLIGGVLVEYLLRQAIRYSGQRKKADKWDS